MLCDNCHQREATCHLCEIVGDVIKTKDLCSQCHEASSPEAREFAAAQRDARCEYCGGEPWAGGTDALALATGIQRLKFMCMPCSMEHNRYVQERLQQDAFRLSPEEQLAWLRKLDKEVDEHMRHWITDTGSQ